MRTRLGILLAATGIFLGACGGAGSPTVAPTSTSSPSTVPPIVTPAPTPTPAETTAPTPNASPAAMPVAAASLPVKENAGELAGLNMAAGPEGGLFVAIPAQEGTIVGSLDAKGRVRSGWPLLLKKATGCTLDADPGDGSLRAVCAIEEAGPLRAFALDASGHLMAGWPVELPAGGLPSWRSDSARVVDGDLYVVLAAWLADRQTATLVRLSRDGSLLTGVSIHDQDLVGCCAAIGPDGTAYLVSYQGSGTPGNVYHTLVSALGLDGLRPGYPVRVEASASVPAFGAGGRVYLAADKSDYTAATATDSSSQVIALDPGGRIADGWPVDLPIDTAAGDSEGVGAPLPPLVRPDGSVYVVAGSPGEGGTIAYAVDPSGGRVAGWPYVSPAGLITVFGGVCTCCSFTDSPPVAGPDGTLYLVQHATRTGGGNRLTAVGTNGAIRTGWPVTLTEAGAWFRTKAIGDDGRVYAFAVEPAGTRQDELCGDKSPVYSGTVVALDGHGDPIYTTTLVTP